VNPGTRDFWGTAIGQGGASDIGACEYASTTQRFQESLCGEPSPLPAWGRPTTLSGRVVMRPDPFVPAAAMVTVFRNVSAVSRRSTGRLLSADMQ